MKKRLISMLLAVLMVVSLFSGMSVSAYADNATYNTIKYTMVAGDYVLRICQRLGLNFYVCKDFFCSNQYIIYYFKFLVFLYH